MLWGDKRTRARQDQCGQMCAGQRVLAMIPGHFDRCCCEEEVSGSNVVVNVQSGWKVGMCVAHVR